MTSTTEDQQQLLEWERKLLDRLARGDRQAFVDLYRHFAPRLYSQVLMPVLGNRSAAEDALSETFRTALQKVGDYQHDQVSVFFWLRRIARNKALDMHRATKVTGRALARFEQMVTPVLNDNPSPETLVSLKWDRPALEGKVLEVLGRLTPRYRRAIELRFFEERSREECAEQLEVKLGTFDVVLLRALRAFRKQWEASGAGSTRQDALEAIRD